MISSFQSILGSNYKTYIVLFLCALIIGIKLGTLIPLLSLILESRGYSNTQIGLNIVAQPLAVILFVRITPIIIHTIGLAKSIVIAQIVTVILTLIMENGLPFCTRKKLNVNYFYSQENSKYGVYTGVL